MELERVMSNDGMNLYDEGGVLRYAPVSKAPVKRSRTLISRILSFLHRAPPARARRKAMNARVRAWEQAMKGVLYIIPADPTAIRERCEITAPPCNEDGKRLDSAGELAGDWHVARRTRAQRLPTRTSTR